MRVDAVVGTPSLGSMADAPWTVKAYAAVEILAIVVWGVILSFMTGRVVWQAWLPGLLNLALAYGILKGYRAAWLIAVGFVVLSVIGSIGFIGMMVTGRGLEPQQWSSMFFFVVSTFLLLHPDTRAWASR